MVLQIKQHTQEPLNNPSLAVSRTHKKSGNFLKIGYGRPVFFVKI